MKARPIIKRDIRRYFVRGVHIYIFSKKRFFYFCDATSSWDLSSDYSSFRDSKKIPNALKEISLADALQRFGKKILKSVPSIPK
jgi:hypothetical protein